MSSANLDKSKSTSALVQEELSGCKYAFKILKSSINLLAHILIGATVGVTVIFVFSSGLPLNFTMLHILLCVLGYHLLMTHAILSLSSNTGWSSFMRLKDKRRAHWILQILGAGLAISGSAIEMSQKSVHFTSMHGKFALVALCFTTVSLVNGLTSLYAYELRNRLPPTLSKVTHIIFGTIAFAAASVTLCYGFNKGFFRTWATEELAWALIGFTATYSVIIIVNPFFTLVGKCCNKK